MTDRVARLEDGGWPEPTAETTALVRRREIVRFLVALSTIAIDCNALVMAAFIASSLRYGGLAPANKVDLIAATIPPFFLASAVFGAYRLDILSSVSGSVRRVLSALLVAAIFGMASAFAFKATASYSRLETGYMFFFAIICLVLWRTFVAIVMHTALQSAFAHSLVVFGDRAAGGVVGLRGTTVIDVVKLGLVPAPNDPSFLERIYSIVRYADRVLLMFANLEEGKAWVQTMRLAGVNAELVTPQLKRMVALGIGNWRGSPTLIISRGPLELHERILKRGFDLGLTLLAAPIVVPIVAICGLLLRLESSGPVFFTQVRVGRNNRRYRCYKLRTMHCDSADPKGDQSTTRDDERITRLGWLFRRTSMDELPQLINVLKGEMSLVGPRPHALGSRAAGSLFWEAVPRYWIRHAMKPGLTGLAQVRGLRGATDSKEDIEKRVAADLEYINSWSIWLDVKILVRTVRVLIHRNAY
jgi:polysaccharide biosynthesis protein PslA